MIDICLTLELPDYPWCCMEPELFLLGIREVTKLIAL